MAGMPDSALLEDPELLETAWNLEDLVDGEGEAGVHRRLDLAHERAQAFAGRYAGHVAELDADGLRAAMEELVEIHDLVSRAGHYASLAFAVDTADPKNGALLQAVEEKSTGLQTTLLFFDLEWAAVPDEQADELLAADGLDFARHHLRSERRYRPHLLSEPEEKILAEKSLTGRSAWTRLFEEQTSAISVELPGEDAPVKLEIALSRLQSPDREQRRVAAESVTAGLARDLRSRAFVFNTLLADKMVDDRLRSYPHWLAARNLANEATDESVQALVEAVRNRYEIPQRWYTLKAQLLGVDKLADYDRMASVTAAEGEVAWPEAKELVTDSYESFSPELGGLVRRFFDEAWIDAPIRPAKRGGAFCAYATPSDASLRDAQLHRAAPRRPDPRPRARARRPRGARRAPGPAAPGDAADAGRDRLGVRRDDHARAAARRDDRPRGPPRAAGRVARRLDRHGLPPDRDEPLRAPRAHRAPRRGRALGRVASASCGARARLEMLGDSVELTEGYTSWWSYIPHFIATPGYVYAYAYGQLLALSVYGKYEAEGADFVPRYLEMLSAGRLQAAGGDRRDRRDRPGRPGLLGRRARPRRPPAHDRRGRGPGGRPDLASAGRRPGSWP